MVEALDGLPSEKKFIVLYLQEQTIHKAINNYREKSGLEKWKDKWES